MRKGLSRGHFRRLVHLSRAAITGAVDELRRRALQPLESVREKLGLAGVPGTNDVPHGGTAPRRLETVGTRTEGPSRPEAAAATREPRPEPSPGRRAPALHADEPARHLAGAAARGDESTPHPADAPEAPDLATEAAAQLQHVAFLVPAEPGAAARGKAPAAPVEPADIPWSYGKDRVTAAAVDPNRLYVYWEVTDEAIERARAALGAAGGDAWLNLRVHDTTGLLFDGTNAHHSFDHGIGRSERQWFFHIGRPTSTVFVEIGLRARDGGFARIARSGRIDFPHPEPAPWTEPEWMTVVASTGDALLTGRGMPSPPGAAPGTHAPAVDGDFAAAPQSFMPIPLWVIRDAAGHATWVRELTHSGWERIEWSEAYGERWFELLGRVEWEGPRTFSTWEAGPFTYPVEVREPTREEWEGQSIAYRVGGITRVVHGPWQVVIRNLGAHVSRSVVARWQIFRSWVAEGGREVRSGAAARSVPLGASEALAGASERIWAGGSELRLGGASEEWRLGASELRFGGASELLYAGASQWRVSGASEQRLGGASEQVRGGASEKLQRGASERLLAGGSERAGASERRLGASDGRFEPPAAAAAPSAYPKHGE